MLRLFKYSLIAFLLTSYTLVAASGGTQISGSQIKDLSIYNQQIATNAAIAWSKISKVGASASDVGAETLLTFNAPLSRVGATISLGTVTVPYGGTGLTSVAQYYVPFGTGTTALTTSANFTFDSSVNKVVTTGIRLTAGATNGYVLQSDANGNGSWVSAAGGLGGPWTKAAANVYLTTGTDSVGLNDATPDAKFTVGATSQFRVNTTGDLIRINDVAYTWPAAQGAASTVLTNDGAGTLTWAATGSAGPWNQSGTFVILDTITDTVGIGTATPSTFKLEVAGDIGPEADNTRSLGSSAKRYAAVHVGPGSLVIHDDNTDTNKLTIGYTAGAPHITETSGNTLSLNATAQLVRNSLALTKTTGFRLVNTTAATALQNQSSPYLSFRADSWDANSLVTRTNTWDIGVYGYNGTAWNSVFEIRGPIRTTGLPWSVLKADNDSGFVAFGAGAGDSATGGGTFLGGLAGYQDTSGNSTFVGFTAGYQNTGGSVVAVGAGAAYANNDSSVTALGTNALGSPAGGVAAGGTAVGYNAGYQYDPSVYGNGPTVVGFNAGYQASGASLTAVGVSAGQAGVGSYYPVYIGVQAGASSSGVTGNIGIGYTALQSTSNTGYNVAVGHIAGQIIKSSFNTLIGTGAGAVNVYNQSGASTAGYNSVVGAFAASQSTGRNITGIGAFGDNPPTHFSFGRFRPYIHANGTWTITPNGVGTLNTRSYVVTFVLNTGESEVSSVIGVGGTNVASFDHTNIPLYSGPLTCTARKLYRRNDSDYRFYLVDTIADNVTTTYSDTQPDATFGAAYVPFNDSGFFGRDAQVWAANELAIGSSSSPLDNIYIGSRYHQTVNNAGRNALIAVMGGHGTDRAGGSLTLQGGFGTGNAAGGDIKFNYYPAGGSGTAAQTATEACRISGSTGTLTCLNGIVSDNPTTPSGSTNVDYRLYNTTANNTQTELLLNGTTAITLENDSTYIVKALVSARNSATDAEFAGYEVTFVFARGAAAVNSEVQGVTINTVYEAVAGWDVTADADTTNGRFRIMVTGENAKTIRWTAKVTAVKSTL